MLRSSRAGSCASLPTPLKHPQTSVQQKRPAASRLVNPGTPPGRSKPQPRNPNPNPNPRIPRDVRVGVSWEGVELGPYKYDTREVKELEDLVPDRLDATMNPRSNKLMRKLLHKHGLDVSTLFEDEEEEEVDLDEWPSWADDDVPEENVEEMKSMEYIRGLPVPGEDSHPGAWDFFIQNVENGYEAKKQLQLDKIFDKAMEIHHNQNARARNIYAATMWYAKVLEQIELWDTYEGGNPCPIPSFLRAFFLLEENFDELNAKQEEVDRKMAERSEKIQEAMFYNWVEENLDIAIDVRSHVDSLDSPTATQPVLEEEDESTTLEIDDLLHGLIPNAEPEGGEETFYDDMTKDLLEGGAGNLEFRETSTDLTFDLPGMMESDASPS